VFVRVRRDHSVVKPASLMPETSVAVLAESHRGRDDLAYEYVLTECPVHLAFQSLPGDC